MTLAASSMPGRPLLATKLHTPRRRHGTVDRQRLKDRLSGANAAPVTLVSAPAGFGKTTLLAEWLVGEGDGGPATPWVSLDAGDNDPSMFWTYVIAAIRRVAPDVGSGSLASLESSQPLASVVAALVNDLDEFADPVVLVLDDYHVIESADIHESVVFLIDHAPASFRLVLATRSDPPIPLARLRARGQLCEVRASDLRFTQGEAASNSTGRSPPTPCRAGSRSGFSPRVLPAPTALRTLIAPAARCVAGILSIELVEVCRKQSGRIPSRPASRVLFRSHRYGLL